ncbi:YkvA family protein [Spirulina sp. CS-785/01]|uniref:YkvA family protein n=1 Tax=Spirulina sp. CS-785/01 TaxID=3021716 RepID=UPI00232AE1CE|nr:YkvA family protein [Spirulina sp. CS-785/01]MDB9312094.1 YkvA family protein [Spirulina sp. CS-785/01]
MNNSVKSLYQWYRNTLRNPQYRWWVILGSLLYLISPIDIAPDLIPLAGQVDDIVLLTLLLTEVSQMVLDFAQQGQTSEVSKETQDQSVKTVDVDAVPLEE